jgi:hypothetical protein
VVLLNKVRVNKQATVRWVEPEFNVKPKSCILLSTLKLPAQVAFLSMTVDFAGLICLDSIAGIKKQVALFGY